MIYIGIYIGILIWMVIGLNKNIPIRLYIAIPFFIMGIVIGLRYNTGPDLENYAIGFSRAVARRVDLYYGMEKSYVLFSQLFDFLKLSFQAMVLFYSLSSFYFMFKGILNLKVTKAEAFIFISVFYSFGFLTFFILMRQFLAASIIFYVFTGNNCCKKEKIRNFILLLIAAFIHRGAIVIVPFFFFINNKIFNHDYVKGIMVLVSILIGGSPIVFTVIRFIVKYMPQYAYYLKKENFGQSSSVSKVIIVLTLIYLISIWLKKRYGSNDKKINLVWNGICLGLCIYYASLPLGWFHRSYCYFAMCLYCIPIYFSRFFSRKRVISFLLIIICSIYSIGTNYNIKNTAPSMIPYQFCIKLIK